MKIKSKIFALLIIACIFLSVSMVSANENLSDEISISEDNQLELNLDKDSENIFENNDDDTSIKAPQGGSSNFTQLSSDLANAESELNITNDYTYEESDADASGNFRIKDLTINGNNHVIDASGSTFEFKFVHNPSSSSSISNLIINDLTFTNFNSTIFLVQKCNIILNNVNFTGCFNNKSALITAEGSIELTVNNCNFMSNGVLNHFNLGYSKVTINDSYFSGTDCIGSAVMLNRGQLIVENSIFENFNAYHGSIINYKGDYFSIRNSKFLNSRADATGGAMIIKFFALTKTIDDERIPYYTSDSIIENCQFINLSSTSNGGAIHLDMDSGTQRVYPNLTVKDSNFTDCKSKFGGAISILGGNVNITNSNFTANTAGFEGGAIYTSWTRLNITNSSFTSNTAAKNAGALYFDKGNLIIKGSNFTSNRILKESNNTANAIYAYDVNAYFYDSIFDNGGVGVYADFAGDSQMINVTKNNDTFLMDNHEYIVSIETPGIKLNLTGNQINVDTLPSRFDGRDWGWFTPVKVQSPDNYDCWAFATIATLETALKKSTGVTFNLSENYVQKLQLKYVKVGDLRNSLTGFMYSGLGYALSWYGVLPMGGVYDDRGMISDTDLDDERIHVQDAMIIYTGQNDTVEKLKWAIIKYGAVTVQSYAYAPDEDIPTEGEDIAIVDHGTHFITLIGWDDNYQEGDSDPHFVWFTKDSMDGYLKTTTLNFPDTDYYAIAPQRAGVAFIFENDIDYHVNYQTDLTGLAGFDGNYTMYSNEFTPKYSEMIGAVGTYFNDSGIEYSFDILVNNTIVHTQSGVSEFAGFRTIVLDKYVPIREGEMFKVVFNSNSVPYQAWSRVHYMEGKSLVSNDNETWTDLAASNRTVCLKVYTLKAGENSFTALADEIKQSGEILNITHDYTFKSEDEKLMIRANNERLVINGNNHIIDGAGIGTTFIFKNIDGEITINDLTFTNFNTTVLESMAKITLNNVNFTGCIISEGPIVRLNAVNATLDRCNFHSNRVDDMIVDNDCNITINNSRFTGNDFDGLVINGRIGEVVIHNSVFENFTSGNASIMDLRVHRFELVNSTFANSRTDYSGGAILAKYLPVGYDDKKCLPSGPIIIMDCKFVNLTAGNDGGAIHIDLGSAAGNHVRKVMYIINTNFTNCSARFGGAISVLEGDLSIIDSNFINNTASFTGGALYTSWTNLNITGSNFTNNCANRNAGALYFDKGNLVVNRSDFTSNMVLGSSSTQANAIYAHDVIAIIDNSSFDNGGVGVYADFADNSQLINVTKNNDTFLMENHNYIISVETPGIKLNFTDNEIIVDKLPSRFDARDWGWTTPGKIQGNNDDCWAFTTVASIETALLKRTGIAYNLSQNYVQEMQLKYYPIGDKRISLTGFSYSGLGYALSWFGVLPMDSPYDDRGMIIDADMDTERIHVQDAMIIYTGQNDTVDNIKKAIMKYGAVSVQWMVYGPDEPVPTEGDDIAIMEHNTHFISLIGWNDDDENGNAVWYTKDSLSGFGTATIENFPQMDYYAIAPQGAAIAYIFENNINYHVNYQTDLTALAGFDGNYTTYSNEFTSKYDELIGAVGTYFNESGIDYSFDVFVNGEKVHTQTGVSEYPGFRTIVLNKYIPVKTGDVFKVVFKSNAVPYQAWSRVHYMTGISFASADGNTWVDFAGLNKTVCLKVYTVADDTKIINNRDISVDYDGGSYFTVKVVTSDGRAVGAGEIVKFTINGKTSTVKTDNDGIARIKISEVPGKYALTTTFNGVSYKNTVTVKHVVTVSKVSVKNTDKKLVLKATVKINGKVIKGKTVKFTFKGKTYKAKTNAKGVAKVTIKKKVIKKLTKKSYPVKVSYLKDSVKGTVKVKQVLKAYKAKVKKSSKKLKLKATLKINGKAAKKKTIKFKFNGKTYKAKTNKKGVAKVTIKKKVIKNLKKGKTYKVKVSYGKAYVKTTVKVKK